MSGRYIAVGLYSGVAVKRGSTVKHEYCSSQKELTVFIWNFKDLNLS